MLRYKTLVLGLISRAADRCRTPGVKTQRSRPQAELVERVGPNATATSDDFDRLSPTFLSLGIRDEAAAQQFVARLYPNERKLLHDIIQRRRAQQYTSAAQQARERQADLHHDELVNLWWLSYAPFLCYGFIDTATMIVAGESFNILLGDTMGVSVMGGAAAGNLVSNLIGIFLLQYVEKGVAYFVVQPNLLKSQESEWSVRFVQNLARVCGILSGCILGMFPLLFYDNERPSLTVDPESYSDITVLEQKENDFSHDWLSSVSHSLNPTVFADYQVYSDDKLGPDDCFADEASVVGVSE